MEQQDATPRFLSRFSQTTAGLKAKFSKLSKRNRIVVGAVAIAIVVSLFSFGGDGSDGMQAMTITAADYEEKIVAAGLLQMAQETSLTAEVSGVVDAVLAKDGDLLTAGSILVHIDDQSQTFQTDTSKATYLDAQAQYRQLVEVEYRSAQAELARLRSLKAQAEKSYQDAQKLFQEGAISQNALAVEKANYDSVVVQWNAADLKVKSLSEGGALRSSAYSRLEGAKATYDRAEDVASNYHISVPWDSVVLKTYVKPQDFVQAGQIIADIGQNSAYHVVVQLDEKYFPYLTKGMPAMVSVGENRVGAYEGKVDVITPKINEETGTFDVEVTIPPDFPYQASDLTVNIEILLQSVPKAITVPAEYLVVDPEGKQGTFVYLYQGGKAVLTEVEVTRGPGSKSVISKGLTEGDVILLPVPELKDGDSVTVSKEG